MPEFKLNGTIYDIPEDIVDQFKKDNPNAVAAGKTSPPKEDNQGVPAEVNVAPKIQPTVTESPSVDISLELPQTGTVDSTTNLKQKDDRAGFLGSIALSPSKIPANIQKQEIGLRDMALLTIDRWINPELSREERVAKLNEYFNSEDDPIAGYPGLGIIRTAQTNPEAEEVVKEIRNKQLKTESESISESIKKGNVIDAAFLATDGLIQTLPSIAFSAYGGGGIITHGALIAGEKFNDEYLKNPKASESAIIANALGTGAIQAGADFLFRGLMKTTGVIAKEGSAVQAKQFLSNSISRVASKYLAVPAEGLVEVSQDLATKGLDDLTFGRDFYKNINKYELIDNFLLGTLMQGGVTVTSYMSGANKDQKAYAEGLLMPENIKPKLEFYSEKYSKIANQINKEENADVKEILKKQLLDIESEVSTLRRKYKTSLYAMNDSELTEYAKNKDLIEKYKSGVNNTLTQESRSIIFKEIDKLNNANKEILKDASTRKYFETTKKAEAQAKKLGVDFNIIESAAEFDEYVKSKGADANQVYSKNDGTIFQYKDGKQEIVINQETALQEESVNVASHELLHAVLFRTLQGKNNAAENLANALTQEISKIDINKVSNSNVASRLRNYADQSEATQYEEVLTLFSDAIATGDINFDENIFTKIGDFTRKLFRGFNENIKFDSGRDVYNFIKDFNNSVDKGIIKGAQKGFTGKLVDAVKIEQEDITKFSKSISGDNIQKIFDEKGKDGAFDIIEAYKPLTTKLANKYRDVPGFDFELLQSEIEIGKRGLLDLINAYDPSKGATLNTYIQGQLANRSIEAANRILDTEFKLDVTEAKGVTDTTTEETIEAAEEAKFADEIKSLRKEIGLSEELVSTVKDAVVKTFGTKLPNPQDPKFRLELQKRFRTELKKPIAKFVGKQADYESFLRDNFQSIYNKLPQSLINRRFKDFQEPVLDKNGKHVREKTAEGNKVYTKKKISKAEFIKYFLGSDVGRSTQGTRKTAIVEAVAEEIAFDATMEVLNDPAVIQKYQDIAGITGEVLPENFKSIIAKQVDRAENFKFSKSIANNAKAEYNLESQELGRILDKTSLDELSDKYSLISDAIIYEADPNNIKFSLTTKADGKWEQNALNPLDESAKLYKFKVGEVDYEINTFKDRYAFNYDIFESTMGIQDEFVSNDPKSWAMAFADALDGSTDLTGVATQGLTNQFKVFGTVANATIDLIKKEKLNSITFSGKEKSRKRLYRSLSDKFAKELGWEAYDFEAQLASGAETVFIVYDPKAFPVEEISNPPQIKFSNSNSKFNVTAEKLLTDKGWAEWSNAKLEGSKILQDEIGNIKTKLGSQRPSYVVSENEIKGFDKLKPKEKQILRKKIEDLRRSIVSYKSKTNFSILKPNESFGNPAKKFGRSATEIENNIKNGNIFKLQNTYSRIYDDMWEKYYNILEKNPNMFDFLESTLQTSSNDVSHWHRLGAKFLGYDPTALKTLALDKNGNERFKTIYTKEGEKSIPITRTFEYEHAVQNHIQWKRVLNAAKRFAKNKNKKDFLDYLKKSKENYVLIAMSVADSKKINEAGYAHAMPKNWKKWVDRYIASNIDLNKIVNINYSNNNAVIDGNIASNFTVKFSKSLNKQFNTILEQSSGIKATKKFSPVEARIAGRGKGKLKLFIPYSADDFVGLLYTTLAGGKTGDQQMDWYRENLLRPFSRGIQQYEAAKQNALREWQILKKEAKKSVPGGLDKKNASGLTNQEAVRLYIWKQQGMEIPGTKGSAAFVNENLKTVRKNPELKAFAERLMALNPEGYPAPSDNWDSGDITTDLVSYIDGVKRGEFLTEFKDNAAKIFSDSNKEKLRALYGDNFIEALDDMLHRMKTGTNRRFGASKIEKQFMDWTNNSVGAIMFFNARSAVLQTLSAVNFINFTDNNPINAAIAFGNFPQYVKDFSTLFNSDFLKQRRTGLQTDVNADEIARAAKGAKNTARAMLSAILKFGFTPTQIADSFAIASGGATFYRNRIKKYKKEGLSQQEAETKAFTDFQEIAEETQQSARPDRISLQQASSLGRLILAFGNTPMQYARLTKKASLDLINGRGDWKTNMSKIMYYSVIQNIIFSALQQGLFALLFDDEDDDKEKSRLFRIGNSSLDTFLRGSGVYGAAAATAKNMILKVIEESEKSRPDYTKVAIESTALSPPINSKLRKLVSAGKTFTYKQSKEKVFTEGFSLENPAFLAGGQVVSALTNLPADRVVLKADHLKTAIEPETELWQSIALSLGWSEWDLNMIQNQTKKPKKIKSSFKTKNFKTGFKTKKFKTK